MEDRWEVTLVRQRKRYRRTFIFHTNGGVRASLKKAKLWRDDMEQRYPPTPRFVQVTKPRVDTPHGIPGVNCRLGADGQPVLWWARTQVFKGRSITKAFSVGRYGDRARDLAIAEREKQLERMRQRMSEGGADQAH